MDLFEALQELNEVINYDDERFIGISWAGDVGEEARDS